MRNRRRMLRSMQVLAAMVAAAFLLVFIMMSVAFSPQAALRALAWGESDVYDYLKFPSRSFEPHGETFLFEEASDADRAREIFEQDPSIDDLNQFLEATHTQALLVIQDDRLLYEGYFNGIQRDSIVTSFSVAKSFDSALIGIAIDEGLLGSVHDPITVYIPELLQRDGRFTQITIHDLLRMSSGLRYEEGLPHGDDVRTYIHPDLRLQALTQSEIIAAPGEYFLYNNYNPLLLGIILERVTGMTVSDFLATRLWDRIGMQYPGSWSLDSRASGFEKMESGINGRAIDFAKFGRLFLNLGSWEGVQILPESWVYESTQIAPVVDEDSYYIDEFGLHILESAEGGYYGYMWYGLERDGGLNDFFASGAKGQYLYLSPQANLIIVRHGEDYGIDAFEWVEIFYRFATYLVSH